MATNISFLEGDYVIFTYNLDFKIPSPVVFELEYHRYHEPSVSDNLDPQVAIDTGSFAYPQDRRFTLPANAQQFRVKMKLDKSVFKVDGTGTWLKVRPITYTQYFTNPDGGIAILEFTDADIRSRMAAVQPQPQSVDEGFTVTTSISVAPPTFAETTVKITLVHGTTIATDIDYIQYSLNNVQWMNIPIDGVVTLPFGTAMFYVRTKTREDFLQEGNETFQVVITKNSSDPDVIRTDSVTLDYLIIDKTVLPVGTLIREYCVGVDLWGEYADGMGGSYDNIIEAKNKPICGYVPPAAGTLLDTFCAGYHKYGHYADGNDGYYTQVIGYNSVDCGFEIGIPNDQDVLTPTAFDPSNKGSTVVLSDGNRMFFGNRRDAARSVYSTLFGKWYFEYEIYIPHDQAESIAVGIVTAGHNLGSWIGATSTSWGWWPHTLTKHYSDIQGDYGLTVHDGDVVSVLLDMMTMKLELWLNGVSMGVMYENLPDVPIYAAINANEESYARANFGDLAFKYTVPAGYYPGFGLLHEPPLARGTLISTFCQGVDSWGTYANGKFGTYNELIKRDDVDCGWRPPSPPYGQVLSYFCVGVDRWVRKSDGDYGHFDELFSINSTQCGYVAPPTPTYTPATLNNTWVSGGTVVSESKLEALLDGAVRATNSVYSGKWYWEVIVDDPAIVIGVGLAGANNTLVVGTDTNGWGWSISTNELLHNDQAGGARPSYGPQDPIASGDVIGVYLDFVAETLSFSVNGVELGPAFTALTNTYFPMISDLSGPLPHVTVNFGATPTVYAPPTDFVRGYGVAASIRPKKGTIQSYYCQGTVRWVRRADGNGGTYNELLQVDSPACGWLPPEPAGKLLSKYCVGVAQWGRYADGNYGTYDELIAERSEACGYLPAGRLISSRCIEFDKWGTFSDGEFGTYVELMQTNSAECGFGGNTGGGGVNPPSIDPNLPVTDRGGLLFDETPINGSGVLVFDTLLPDPPAPSPYPDPGIFLGTGCLDGWLCNVYTDGAGGQIYNRVQEKHRDCREWVTHFEVDMADGEPTNPIFATVSGHPSTVPGTISYDSAKQAMFMPASNSYNGWDFVVWFDGVRMLPSTDVRITVDMELTTPKGASIRAIMALFNWRDNGIYSNLIQHWTTQNNINMSTYQKQNNSISSAGSSDWTGTTPVTNWEGRHTYVFSNLSDTDYKRMVYERDGEVIANRIASSSMGARVPADGIMDKVGLNFKGEPVWFYKVKIETIQNKAKTFEPLIARLAVNGELKDAVTRQNYTSAVQVMSANLPVQWSRTGALPPGLTATTTADTYTLSGIPAPGSEGAYTFTLTATDAIGEIYEETHTVCVGKVSALLHFEGANGATTFVEETGKTLTRGGNTAQHTTTSSRVGTSSGQFAGNTGYLQMAGGPDFQPGRDPFTVSCWVRMDQTPPGTFYCPWGNWFSTAPGASMCLFIRPDGTVQWQSMYDINSAAGQGPVVGQWTHIEVSRDHHQTLRVFVNGTVVIERADYTENLNSSANFRIAHNGVAGDIWPGLIDEFIFVKGAALHTSNFTPSTQPYELL